MIFCRSFGLISTFAVVSSQVYECYNKTDKGASYRGKGTRTDCITWKEANSPYAKYYEDHAYCRNPLPEEVEMPYCYTGSNSAFKKCDDIMECGNGCSTEVNGGEQKCELYVTCKPPSPSPRLRWNPDITLLYADDTIEFMCTEKGYLPSVSSTTCLQKGILEHPSVECKGIKCPDFPTIKKMITLNISESYRYPESIKITCQSGYEKIGPVEVKCTETGVWSQLPNCTGITCPILQNVTNSQNDHSKQYRFPNSVLINCKTGYINNGSNKVFCTSTGIWNQSLPTCIAFGSTLQSSSAVPVAIAGGNVAAVIVLIIAIAVLFYKRRRTDRHTESRKGALDISHQETNTYANYQSKEKDGRKDLGNDDHTYYDFDATRMSKTAIELDAFHEYVERGRGVKGDIETEFSLLATGLIKSTNAAQLPANSKKNKYKNIYPYDETRVALEQLEDSLNSDYINASFINGYGQLKKYIASQGPLVSTVDDWWRMVWQYDCGKIVMLTRVFEMGKHKCIQYWPDQEQKTITFGKIEISIRDEDVYSDFTIRTLQLVLENVSKTVKHFHFTAWPDKDVPKYASSLVYFRHKVNNTKTTYDGPLLVHCSAGIGRTGTYIALDYAVTEANQLGYVDIFRCVELLRRQRPNMVQTARQYVFLHETVLDALMWHTSGISAAEFPEEFRQAVMSKSGKNKLQKDYELMTKLGHNHEEEVFEIGKSAENRSKNRYNNVLPARSEMPALSTSVEGHNEYINAVFLPSYRDNKTFIITQMPLQNTIIDLWRLVWDYNIGTIVMLNQSYDQKEVYWPTSQQFELECGPFTVALRGYEEHEVFYKRQMILTYNKEDQREVKLLQSRFWSEDATIPSSIDDFVCFITELEREHNEQTGGPVVVHCSNGCDKSGLYCVMATVLERLRIEQDVDIQHIVQQMRNRRPQIIPNYVQYYFLHEAVIRYLQQFETYSNFK